MAPGAVTEELPEVPPANTLRDGSLYYRSLTSEDLPVGEAEPTWAPGSLGALSLWAHSCEASGQGKPASAGTGLSGQT